VLLATDAAGEGINLQRAHLMVNYDLPWNPNRLEQRFGRIHRIGQTEVCHLWNLVADETARATSTASCWTSSNRPGRRWVARCSTSWASFSSKVARCATCSIEAIRYGERPEVRARLTTAVDHALDRGHIQDLLEERAWLRTRWMPSGFSASAKTWNVPKRAGCSHTTSSLSSWKPSSVSAATVKQREPRRYEITHVPAPVRNRDRLIGIGEPVLPRYERIAFEKSLVAPQGQSLAAFVCPGHPLLDAVIDLTLERHRDLLKRGAVLVDERDLGTSPRCSSTSNTRSRMPALPATASGASSQSECCTSDRRQRRHSPHPLCALPRLPAAEDAEPEHREPCSIVPSALDRARALEQQGARATP
jgi:hypothetical protein